MSTYLRTEEGSHFYTLAGLPCHEVASKSGGLRPTTLRDARKLRLVPSVSGIIKFPFEQKQNLVGYFVDSALEAVLTSPGVQLALPAGQTLKQFCDEVLIAKQEQREESRSAAEFGTAFHAAMAQSLRGEAYDERLAPWVTRVTAHVRSLGEPVHIEWPAASATDGFGGTIDLVVRRPDGSLCIVDYKTTKRLPKKPEPWPDHAKQLAAYGRLVQQKLGEPVAGLQIVYILSDSGMDRQWWRSEVEILPAPVESAQQAERAFLCLLNYWKIEKEYDPCAI